MSRSDAPMEDLLSLSQEASFIKIRRRDDSNYFFYIILLGFLLVASASIAFIFFYFGWYDMPKQAVKPAIPVLSVESPLKIYPSDPGGIRIDNLNKEIFSVIGEADNTGESAIISQPQPASSIANTEAEIPKNPYQVQVASFRTQARAKIFQANFIKKMPQLTKDKSFAIRKIVTKNDGDYFQVAVIHLTRQQARKLCADLKAKKQSCIVKKNIISQNITTQNITTQNIISQGSSSSSP